MKRYLPYALFLFSAGLFAQAPSIEWQKTIGGTSFDKFHGIAPTSDGGCIAVGDYQSIDGDLTGNHGDNDVIVMKIDESGVVEWQELYGGSNYDGSRAIQQTEDGGYIFVGTTRSNDGDVSGWHGNTDYWVVKLTSQGIISWQKCFGGTSNDSGNSVMQTADGGYIVGGSSLSTNGDVTGNHVADGPDYDYWVLKLDSSGTIEWKKCYGSHGSETLFSIRQTNDGGYIMNGDTSENGGDVTGFHGDFDYWIVKVDSTGQLEWQKAMGGTNWDTGVDIIQDSQGDYVACGYTASHNGDVVGGPGSGNGWVIKLGAGGDVIWQKPIGGSESDFFYSIQQTVDGGYLLCGDSVSNDGDATGHHGTNFTYDFWAVKLLVDGNVEWHKSLGGSLDDTAVSMVEVSEGNYVICGYTESVDGDVLNNHGALDGWLVKLSHDLGVEEMPFGNTYAVYPNPAKEVIHVKSDKQVIGSTYSIYDQLGRVVRNGVLVSQDYPIPVYDLRDGVYILRVEDSINKFIKR